MKMMVGLIVGTCLLFASDANARNTRHMFLITEALQSSPDKSRLDKTLELYFGDQSHPSIATRFGTFTTNRKTNSFNKSDKAACEWAFLSAMLSLQERARREGGNAIVNIRSYYKKQEISSRTEYMCGAGAFVTGVTFLGTVVKLRK